MFPLFSSSVCQFLPLSTFSASANHGLFSWCRVADPDAHGSASFWGSWYHIWIRIRVKCWIRIRIRIKVKTQELQRLNIKLWRAWEAYNGCGGSQNGALKGLQTNGRRFALHGWWAGSRSTSRSASTWCGSGTVLCALQCIYRFYTSKNKKILRPLLWRLFYPESSNIDRAEANYS